MLRLETSRDDFLSQCTLWTDTKFRRGFNRLGQQLEKRPFLFIGLALILTGLSAGGYLGAHRRYSFVLISAAVRRCAGLNLVVDRDQLFTSRNSPAFDNRNFVEQYFGDQRALIRARLLAQSHSHRSSAHDCDGCARESCAAAVSACRAAGAEQSLRFRRGNKRDARRRDAALISRSAQAIAPLCLLSKRCF